MTFIIERSANTAFAFGEDIEASPDDLIYVADLLTSEIFCFSGSAAVIWCLIEEAISIEELVSAVAEVFGESTETVRADTLSFVESLVASKLLIKS